MTTTTTCKPTKHEPILQPTTVRVTRDDIRNGRRRALFDCPVALAILPPLHLRFGTVAVGSRLVKISYERVAYVWPLPLFLQNWVRAYDTYDKVEPITFTLPALNTLETVLR